MVHYSFSTILMTFITSNLIIVLITMCFKREKILLSIGYKLTAVFLVLTLLRVLFPFELPFAKNVYLPTALSAVIVLIRHPFLKPWGLPVSLWTAFELVWIIGFIIRLYKQNKEHKAFYRFLRLCGRDITMEEPYHSVLSTVCGMRKNPFRLLRVPNLQFPVLVGIWHPCILLPDHYELTPDELYYTLRHETFHHYKRDLITKYGVSLLCMIYWWNPACVTIKKQLYHVMEMRVDENVADMDKHTAVAYLSSIINIMENLQSDDQVPVPSGISAFLTKEQTVEVRQRFHMLCNKKRTQWPLFIALLTLIVGIYLGSYLVIFEADFDPKNTLTRGTFAVQNEFYAILLDNGMYDIYCGDFFIETTNALDYYPLDIPIFTQ